MMKSTKIIIILIGGLILMSSCMHTKKEVTNSFYLSEEGKAASHNSYDQTMALWDAAYDEEWVDTTFGSTHIITAGPKNGKPLFLLPGLFADASMWYANSADLAKSYRVIAVDLPVYGGKSEPSQTPITAIEDYTKWYTELLTHFNYSKAALAGLSYGSWLSLALAREVPDSVAAIIMLDPSETFAKMSPVMAVKGFQYFMFFPNRTKYKRFFSWMGGGYSDSKSDIWLEHMIDVIEFGSVGMMDVPQHRVYTREELEMITMPVLILAGEKPIVYKDPEAFAEAARQALPDAVIEIIPDTGHSLNVEKPDQINSRMLLFLSEYYT